MLLREDEDNEQAFRVHLVGGGVGRKHSGSERRLWSQMVCAHVPGPPLSAALS